MNTGRELAMLIWNNGKSFKSHIDAMRTFRQSHNAPLSDRLFLKDMLTLYDSAVSQIEEPRTYLTDLQGKEIFVPIWRIAAPTGSQN